jgi:nuclear transport factor 2 (NTF2) superfamily protein
VVGKVGRILCRFALRIIRNAAFQSCASVYARDCDVNVNGREQIVGFLARKWAKELNYRLIKELWVHVLMIILA